MCPFIDETVPELITGVESLLFDLCALRLATANFSEENKLGEGGFGAVYKVRLHDLLFSELTSQSRVTLACSVLLPNHG